MGIEGLLTCLMDSHATVSSVCCVLVRYLALAQPRKTCPNMTEKMLTEA